MSENQEIVAVANILRTHGDMFSGGFAEEYAKDWLSCDFTADGVSEWCEVGCWDANTADTFETYGMTPAQARKACDAYDVARNILNGGDAMYACCNNDLCVEDVIAAWKAR